MSWGSLSSGALCQPDPRDRDPQYGNERAVRILLECILVAIHSCYSYVNDACVVVR